MHSLPIRTLAALMSLYLIGLVVACVVLCSSHSDESRETDSEYSSTALLSSHEEGCCPITSVPAIVLPDRSLFTPPPATSQPVAIISREPIATGLISHIWTASLHHSTGPPLERLSTWRI